MTTWPKAITEWQSDGIGYLSVPFTWLLPEARQRARQRDLYVRRWVVGGPAVRLMPDYEIEGATVADMPGVLQRVNRDATRTTVGCVRNCRFCGVRQIEGAFGELPDWPDRPILCDNNLLASSHEHFGRVVGRLVRHGWCDFSQGLDAQFLSGYHAKRIAEIGKPTVRFALDSENEREPVADAVDLLRSAGVAKSRIRCYVLCGFNTGPEEAKARCNYVETLGVKPLPMWYHALDALERNAVTNDQQQLGWTPRKRRELFCWYYQHRTLDVRG